jgi:uncharacterized membrane protein HdeD (DUF308 family)
VNRPVLVAGLRRFFTVFGAAVLATGLASALVGVLAGADLSRSLAVGYYLVGATLLIGGFFIGNRGPVRAKRNQPIPIIGTRFVRWATAEELDEAINASAVYVSLGFALILVGVLADTV